MNFEEAQKARDRRLRRQLLVVMESALAHFRTGLVGGEFLRDQANSLAARDQRFENDAHCLRLCRELVNKGLAEEQTGKRQQRGEPFGLAHVAFRITDKGGRLRRQEIEVDPDVDDDRMVD